MFGTVMNTGLQAKIQLAEAFDRVSKDETGTAACEVNNKSMNKVFKTVNLDED